MRQVIAVLTVAVVVAGLGAGAYFVGHSGGEDLAAAHAAGARAGAKSGEHRGRTPRLCEGVQAGALAELSARL